MYTTIDAKGSLVAHSPKWVWNLSPPDYNTGPMKCWYTSTCMCVHLQWNLWTRDTAGTHKFSKFVPSRERLFSFGNIRRIETTGKEPRAVPVVERSNMQCPCLVESTIRRFTATKILTSKLARYLWFFQWCRSGPDQIPRSRSDLCPCRKHTRRQTHKMSRLHSNWSRVYTTTS